MIITPGEPRHFAMRAGLFFLRTIGIRICKGKKTHKTCSIVQFAGLHRRSPLLAMGLLAGVFNLGGIPPTIGFTGKFLIFNAAMERGYFFLVLIAMINMVISLYYYIMVVKAAFLLEPEEELPPIHLSIPATARRKSNRLPQCTWRGKICRGQGEATCLCCPRIPGFARLPPRLLPFFIKESITYVCCQRILR